jgi:glycosyltransferase involved in cell wall biosynthesis
MRVSAIMPNLATNHIVRVAPIVKALARDHEVELIGFLKRGEVLFPPFAREFDYRIVGWDEREGFVPALRALQQAITGDVLYAFQPATLSYGGALLHKLRRRGLPLILDMTDWEVWGMYQNGGGLRHGVQVARTLLGSGWRAPNSWKYRYLVDKLIRFADAKTVVATFLQRRYGGVLLRHGPDTSAFDPARFDGRALREKWGLGRDLKIILFGGTPSAWKGVDQLLAALELIGNPGVKVVAAGKPMATPHDAVIHVGFVPHGVMPELLAMADLVVLPQRRHPMAEAQIPNKLFEAMAMAKPVVAYGVGDVPEVLAGCGIVVEPEDVAALADGIQRILDDPVGAREMGWRAREKCMAEYSWDAIARVLTGVLRPFV